MHKVDNLISTCRQSREIIVADSCLVVDYFEIMMSFDLTGCTFFLSVRPSTLSLILSLYPLPLFLSSDHGTVHHIYGGTILKRYRSLNYYRTVQVDTSLITERMTPYQRNTGMYPWYAMHVYGIYD